MPNKGWECPDCGGTLYKLPDYDAFRCLTCAKPWGAKYIADLANNKTKKPAQSSPGFGGIKNVQELYRHEPQYDRVTFGFTVELRVTPCSWDPAKKEWIPREGEAFVSEVPEGATVSISQQVIDREGGEGIERYVVDMAEMVLMQGSKGAGRKLIDKVIGDYFLPVLQKFLANKDWSKVPQVDEAWVNEIEKET